MSSLVIICRNKLIIFRPFFFHLNLESCFTMRLLHSNESKKQNINFEK